MIETIQSLVGTLNVPVRNVYPELENLTITPSQENQTFNHENSYGYDEVVVNAANLQSKEVTPTKDAQVITNDDEYIGLNQVTVNPIPDRYVIPSGSITITENGEHNVSEYETIVAEIGSPPTTTSECNERMNNLIIEYENYLREHTTDSYGCYTTDNITLYTPDIDNSKYAIRQRSYLGPYQILWFPTDFMCTGASNQIFTVAEMIILNTSTTIGDFSKDKRIRHTVNTTVLTDHKVYKSDDFQTLSEAIEAIKNPQTIYTLSNTSKHTVSYSDYDQKKYTYFARYSNMARFETTRLTDRISSNEVIQEIPT